MLIDLLSYGFLQRALLSGLFVAVACAFLGIFIILRRDSMIGHGLAHVTFAGVAIGIFLDVMPLAAALVVALITAFVIMKLKNGAGIYGDTAIAIFSSVGFAAGILLVSLARGFNIDLFGYLFGEILAIETAEVWMSIALALVVVAVILRYFRRFMYMTFDRESALASGIKVNRLDTVLTLLTAVTVVLGMKVVGILLVAALLVIPAAAGLQLASSFKQAVGLSVGVAVVSVLAGLVLAFSYDLPASASIVLFSFALFLVFTLLKRGR